MSQATTVLIDSDSPSSLGSKTLSYHSESEDLIPTLQPDAVSLTQQESQDSEAAPRRSPRLAMLRTASSKTDSIRSGKSITNALLSRKMRPLIQEAESIESEDSRSHIKKTSPKSKKSSPKKKRKSSFASSSIRSRKGAKRSKLILEEV